MQRREFIKLIGGAAAAWPLVARAQQGERMRRIGVVLSTREDDPQRRAQLAAFVQRLTELGWADGHNARLDVRWTAGSVDAPANTRRNWSRPRRTSSSQILVSTWPQCSR